MQDEQLKKFLPMIHKVIGVALLLAASKKLLSVVTGQNPLIYLAYFAVDLIFAALYFFMATELKRKPGKAIFFALILGCIFVLFYYVLGFGFFWDHSGTGVWHFCGYLLFLAVGAGLPEKNVQV